MIPDDVLSTNSDTENIMVVLGWHRRRNRELVFNGNKVLFQEDEKFLKMDDGDGYTTT